MSLPLRPNARVEKGRGRKLQKRSPHHLAVENRRLIAGVVQAGFTINLSADNPAHADRLAEWGIAPVVTVLARDYARRAVRHRFKRHRDEWAETTSELA